MGSMSTSLRAPFSKVGLKCTNFYEGILAKYIHNSKNHHYWLQQLQLNKTFINNRRQALIILNKIPILHICTPFLHIIPIAEHAVWLDHQITIMHCNSFLIAHSSYFNFITWPLLVTEINNLNTAKQNRKRWTPVSYVAINWDVKLLFLAFSSDRPLQIITCDIWEYFVSNPTV